MSDELKKELQNVFPPYGSCNELYAALYDSGLDALAFEDDEPSDLRIVKVMEARGKMQTHCALSCLANRLSGVPLRKCSLDGTNENPDDEAHFKRVFGAILYDGEVECDETDESEPDYWEY